MALIKCPNCGRTISDVAAVCPSCGYTLKVNRIQCPECGNNVSADASTCPYCGYPVSKKDTHSQKRIKRNKRKLLIALSAVCTICLLLTGIRGLIISNTPKAKLIKYVQQYVVDYIKKNQTVSCANSGIVDFVLLKNDFADIAVELEKKPKLIDSHACVSEDDGKLKCSFNFLLYASIKNPQLIPEFEGYPIFKHGEIYTHIQADSSFIEKIKSGDIDHYDYDLMEDNFPVGIYLTNSTEKQSRKSIQTKYSGFQHGYVSDFLYADIPNDLSIPEYTE